MPTGDHGKNTAEPVYKPLTQDERSSWNEFLRFVYSKGLTGSKILDQRDRGLGNELMAEFNKTNPRLQVTPELVPRVQSEFQYFKQNGVFPGYRDGELGSFQGILGMNLKDKQISPVDSWLGSITSQQVYPVAIDASGKNFGTDYTGFVKEMESKYKNYGDYLKPNADGK